MPPLRIAELRERLRLTQEQLGLIMMNHPDPGNASRDERAAARMEVWRYENGERVPSWERLVALAQVHGCKNVRDLIEPMPTKKWRRKLDEIEVEWASKQTPVGVKAL